MAALAQLGERQTEDLKAPCSIHGGGISFFLTEYVVNCCPHPGNILSVSSALQNCIMWPSIVTFFRSSGRQQVWGISPKNRVWLAFVNSQSDRPSIPQHFVLTMPVKNLFLVPTSVLNFRWTFPVSTSGQWLTKECVWSHRPETIGAPNCIIWGGTFPDFQSCWIKLISDVNFFHLTPLVPMAKNTKY